jgi:hypothetical protein
MDILAECFPVAQKFQRLNYGHADALGATENPWQITLTKEKEKRARDVT